MAIAVAEARKNNPAATRQAILDAATTLFAERGVGRTSLAHIAKLAGVTKSLIHHHFGSKSELWAAVRELGMREYFEAQQKILQSRPADGQLFADSIDTYFRFLQERPQLVRLMAWMAVDPECDKALQAEKVLRLGIERIDSAKKQGLVRDEIDAMSAILSFLGTIERWFVQREMFHGQLSEEEAKQLDERFVQTLKHIYLHGLAAPESP
ncbi:MAG: TetR/AcrR family transcriptional regulator [Bradymonadia bacterium]